MITDKASDNHSDFFISKAFFSACNPEESSQLWNKISLSDSSHKDAQAHERQRNHAPLQDIA